MGWRLAHGLGYNEHSGDPEPGDRHGQGVKVVRMTGGVTLDMETLAQYDGKGECRSVRMYDDTRRRYGDQVKAWARRMKWRVIEDDGYLNYEDDDFISIYG